MTFGTGPLAQLSGPTIVSSSKVESALTNAEGLPTTPDFFNVAIATSKSACTKPIGWVHCCWVTDSYLLASAAHDSCVSELLNGCVGPHQYSVLTFSASEPNACAALGNNMALAMVATFG